MSKLKQAIDALESTTRRTADNVRELRHWRLAAERRFMTVVVKAATHPKPSKGRAP